MMEPNPLRTTLDTLRSERAVAESRASELRTELQAVGQRLAHLHGAIQNIEALLGITRDEDEDVVPRLGRSGEAPTLAVDLMDTPEFVVEVPRKRVPSTEWVVEVVDRIGRPASRNEIYAAFADWKGIPTSWVTPRNSFNNALGRAVERDLIQKLSDDEFAPRSWNLFEGHTTSDPGGS